MKYDEIYKKYKSGLLEIEADEEKIKTLQREASKKRNDLKRMFGQEAETLQDLIELIKTDGIDFHFPEDTNFVFKTFFDKFKFIVCKAYFLMNPKMIIDCKWEILESPKISFYRSKNDEKILTFETRFGEIDSLTKDIFLFNDKEEAELFLKIKQATD